MSRIRHATAAIGCLTAPIAAIAVITGLALTGCSTNATPPQADRPPASAPSVTAPAPTESPESTAQAPATTAIPLISAALDDRPPLTGPRPVRLVAPELGIDVPIESVGLDDEGRMGLPADPSVAAWYSYGVAPGDPAGSAVVAAHVDSLEYDIGPFARLADAASGTVFDVTSADGTVREFALESTELVLKGTVDWSTVFRRSGAPVLTLVTCGGEFDWDARRYLSTVIVTARAVG